ncbi:MAG: nucleoside-diphosphate kinase [Nitrospirota bacterium]
MERTLAIVKPDAVEKGFIGEIIKRYETNGLGIVGMKMLHLTREEAEGFYYIHRERPFFKSLVDFMSSGYVVVLVLEGDGAIKKNRDLMGATDPGKAEPCTIRHLFGANIEKNAVHGSDSMDSAAFEIAYFFNRLEMMR